MAGLIYLRPGQVKLKKNYNAVIQRYINIIAAQKIHNTYLAVRKSVCVISKKSLQSWCLQC